MVQSSSENDNFQGVISYVQKTVVFLRWINPLLHCEEKDEVKDIEDLAQDNC